MGGQYGFQLFEQFCPLSGLAATEISNHRAGDVPPRDQHAAALFLAETRKSRGKGPIKMAGQAMAELACEFVESPMRLVCREYADESRRLGLDRGNAVNEPPPLA